MASVLPLLKKSRIFDKFYRVAGSASRATGTGMGLAIVKGLAEAHGGSVHLHSTVGHGSTFTVILPLNQPESHDPESRRHAAQPVEETTTQ